MDKTKELEKHVDRIVAAHTSDSIYEAEQARQDLEFWFKKGRKLGLAWTIVIAALSFSVGVLITGWLIR